MISVPQPLTIRCGFEFAYEAAARTPAILKIDPLEVHLGDPINLSRRLDGTPTLRFPPRMA